MKVMQKAFWIFSYVQLQKKLLAKLESEFGYRVDRLLLKLPQKGQINVEEETWQFRKHGLGVSFTNVNSRIIVDVHQYINEPELFDTWRIATYLGSLGHRGERLLRGQVDESKLSLIDRIETYLESLLAEGVLERRNDAYAIVGK